MKRALKRWVDWVGTVVEQAHKLRGLCLDAEVSGSNPTSDNFLHVFPLSLLSLLSLT